MVEKKTYIGKIAAVAKEVRTTSKPGLCQVGFKGTDETWYNFSDSETACKVFIVDALDAKNNDNTVKVDYEDNEWHNIVDHDFDFKVDPSEESVKDETPETENDKTKRKVTLMVGLAKTINLGDYENIKPEFRIEEVIEGTLEDIEKLKDEWIERFKLWISHEESQYK